MRSFGLSTKLLALFCLPLLAALSACPKPLPPEENWQPFPGAPATRKAESQVSEEQKQRVQRLVLEAKIRKMRAAFVKPGEKTCTTDADCTLTPLHCCSCAAGGQMDAVRAEDLPAVIKRRGHICEDYACPQVVSTHLSCNATKAVCREGACVPDVPEGAAEGPKGIGEEPIPEKPPADKGDEAP